jgi:hypothetical protein
MTRHNAYVQVQAGNKFTVICPNHAIQRRFAQYPEAVDTARKHNHLFETLAWSPDE